MFLTPLRYPGGKTKLAPFIQELFEVNDLGTDDYVEPFAGGAGVAINLLIYEFVRCVHLNDADRAVWAFWKSALDETESLCRLIRDTPVTVSSWDKQKHVLSNLPEHTSLDIGFAFFFLNRTNRSGIVSGAGMIGGRDQDKTWKIDARYHAQNLCLRIEKIAKYRSRIQLYNLDAVKFLAGIEDRVSERSLVYLDPPYFRAGRRLYRDYYTHEGHTKLARHVQCLNLPWVVTYDEVPGVDKLYAGRRTMSYRPRYSAQNHRTGTEVMFISDDLIIPEELPSAVSLRQTANA